MLIFTYNNDQMVYFRMLKPRRHLLAKQEREMFVLVSLA